jgi:hypothetical protein
MVKENFMSAPVEKISEFDLFRIYAISNVALGRDEKVFLTRNIISTFNPGDPYFSRIKDLQSVDVVIDVVNAPVLTPETTSHTTTHNKTSTAMFTLQAGSLDDLGTDIHTGLLSSLINNIQSMLSEGYETPVSKPQSKPQLQPLLPAFSRELLPAALPSGPGSAILPELPEPADMTNDATRSTLPWNTIHVINSELCDSIISPSIVKENQVLVIRRGGCSFSQKLRNIPSFAPSRRSLQLVIVVSFPEHDAADAVVQRQNGGTDENVAELMQPYLDVEQMTPGGVTRMHAIPMVKVQGGQVIMDKFTKAAGVGVRRRWWFESQGTRIGNLYVV